MHNQTMIRVLGVALILSSLIYQLSGQNCVGLQNLDVLNIARQIDPRTLANVSIKQNSISAHRGFKFVQLRDTETYIMVPEEYQDRFIDFRALAINAAQSTFVLDVTKLTAKIICTARSGGQNVCKHQRISRSEVGCLASAAVQWVSAPALAQKFIIIPHYVKK
ncbi:MAG: hypothetical protein IPL46_23190 [Saprospiraceae bacterium]|nr:hypothetical protein [Saprospiraceae bacterium]